MVKKTQVYLSAQSTNLQLEMVDLDGKVDTTAAIFLGLILRI
jgi:hypothetical protein